MSVIRYKIHFVILALATITLWLARDVDFAVRISGLNLFDSLLIGILHAVSVVVSLRNRKSDYPITAPSFVLLAAVWSAATPLLALSSSAVWRSLMEKTFYVSDSTFVFVFLTGSAIGSAGYWLLVRMFWLKSLRAVDCLRTVALCVAATSMCFAVGIFDQRGGGEITSLLFTVFWWFAFSISLYWSEMSKRVDDVALLRT